MKKVVIYIHGKGGSADEAQNYKPIFKEYDVMGYDYKAQTPWEAKEEFPTFIGPLCQEYESVIVIANSIGAYYAMHALSDLPIDKAFLISPIVDMEQLILNMMMVENVTENDLRKKNEIPTAFGETLSWDYLNYVRTHPNNWTTSTEILYGEQDNLTSYKTISDFANRIRAGLTVMKDGEHWFHTGEQLAFLHLWIKKLL